jgi:polar amino acid transport system substrate-binding protein
MKKLLLKIFLLTSFIVFFSGQVFSETLNVGVIERKPFAFKEFSETENTWTGISIDLISEIFKDKSLNENVKINFVEFKVFSDMVNAVASGTVNMSIANISVTEDREKILDLSHFYFESGLQMFASKNLQKLNIWEAFRSSGALKTLQFMIFFMILGTVLYSILEMKLRSLNEETRLFKKMGRSLWWSVQRILNVDVDMKDAITTTEKIVAFSLTLVSIFSMSIFTAQLASSMTAQIYESDIKTVFDLKDKKVLVLENSSSAKFLDKNAIKYSTVVSPKDLYENIGNQKFDVGVYDKPLIQYEISQNKNQKIVLIGDVLQKDFYGVALPTNSKNKEFVNRGIIKNLQNGFTQTLTEKYLK